MPDPILGIWFITAKFRALGGFVLFIVRKRGAPKNPPPRTDLEGTSDATVF